MLSRYDAFFPSLKRSCILQGRQCKVCWLGRSWRMQKESGIHVEEMQTELQAMHIFETKYVHLIAFPSDI